MAVAADLYEDTDQDPLAVHLFICRNSELDLSPVLGVVTCSLAHAGPIRNLGHAAQELEKHCLEWGSGWRS